jgi:5-formyltetrahydrofolate cyclo-ligase
VPTPQSGTGDHGPVPDAASVAKIALRDRVRTTRHRRSLLEVGEAARGIADVLMHRPELMRAATVAAYVSIGSEPGTGPLLDALTDAGKRVILPVVLPDLDLEWGTWRGETSLAPARRGLLEPVDRLGLDAVATADVVVVPGQAVSPTGDRLGQGGGCYDRALSRVPLGTPVVVCLYDDEVGLDVPVADHDRPVTAAVTPTRWVTLR